MCGCFELCVAMFVCCGCFIVCFFFKQKTAYEMRISDWSSDVCSSDLADGAGVLQVGDNNNAAISQAGDVGGSLAVQLGDGNLASSVQTATSNSAWSAIVQNGDLNTAGVTQSGTDDTSSVERSEEHTSELQSLMRISYAVFCLKKKKLDTHI